MFNSTRFASVLARISALRRIINFQLQKNDLLVLAGNRQQVIDAMRALAGTAELNN